MDKDDSEIDDDISDEEESDESSESSSESSSSSESLPPLLLPDEGIVLQAALIVPGRQTSEGLLIQAVAPAWFEIIRKLEADPSLAFKLNARDWEIIIAGAYDQAGFDEVTLTPQSGDRGRDVIAVKRGFGTVRIIDQVKAFRPGHLVTANDVRAGLPRTADCRRKRQSAELPPCP
jgi:restriction system protein